MKFRDEKVKDALRGALLKLHADRHTLSYYEMNKLYVWVMLENSKLAKGKRRRLVRNLNGFKWALYEPDGTLLVGEIDASLSNEAYRRNHGGCFATDLHTERVKTILFTYDFPEHPERVTGYNPAASAAGVKPVQD